MKIEKTLKQHIKADLPLQSTASFLYTASSSVDFLSDSSDIHQLCTHPSVLRLKPMQEICLYMPAAAVKLTGKELQVW